MRGGRPIRMLRSCAMTTKPQMSHPIFEAGDMRMPADRLAVSTDVGIGPHNPAASHEVLLLFLPRDATAWSCTINTLDDA